MRTKAARTIRSPVLPQTPKKIVAGGRPPGLAVRIRVDSQRKLQAIRCTVPLEGFVHDVQRERGDPMRKLLAVLLGVTTVATGFALWSLLARPTGERSPTRGGREVRTDGGVAEEAPRQERDELARAVEALRQEIVAALASLREEVDAIRRHLEAGEKRAAEEKHGGRPAIDDEESWRRLLEQQVARLVAEQVARHREHRFRNLFRAEAEAQNPQASADERHAAPREAEAEGRALAARESVRTLRDMARWRHEFGVAPE
jgi:hypothetical protein